MSFINRFRTWLAYKRCIRKHDIAIERMQTCLEGTSLYVVWMNIAMEYLDLAMEYKAKLDT